MFVVLINVIAVHATMIALYGMENNTGDLFVPDSSGRNAPPLTFANQSSSVGGIFAADCTIGNCVEFSNSHNFVGHITGDLSAWPASSVNPLESFTICMRLQFFGTQVGAQTILARFGGAYPVFALYIPGGVLKFTVKLIEQGEWATVECAPYSLANGQPYSVCVAFRKYNQEYMDVGCSVNGSVFAMSHENGVASTSNADIVIGSLGSEFPFNYKMDELSFFDTWLSSSELADYHLRASTSAPSASPTTSSTNSKSSSSSTFSTSTKSDSSTTTVLKPNIPVLVNRMMSTNADDEETSIIIVLIIVSVLGVLVVVAVVILVVRKRKRAKKMRHKSAKFSRRASSHRHSRRQSAVSPLPTPASYEEPSQGISHEGNYAKYVKPQEIAILNSHRLLVRAPVAYSTLPNNENNSSLSTYDVLVLPDQPQPITYEILPPNETG